MSGALFRMLLVAIGVVAAFIITSAGHSPATPVTSLAFQYPWQQVLPGVGAEVQGSGYMKLAGETKGGAKVRDHRSCAPNCGPYDASGGHRGPSHSKKQPPPVSPGDGQGGVTVTPSGTQRGIPCLGNLC